MSSAESIPVIPAGVLEAYNLSIGDLQVQLISSGLINQTWKLSCAGKERILQRINTNVFKEPGKIAVNIEAVKKYLSLHFPSYLLPTPIATIYGDMMFELEGEYYRLIPFVAGSHTVAVVATAEQAYEAAAQFGKFTCNLTGFDAGKLEITIPDFHNLELRYDQFVFALQHAEGSRVQAAKEIIAELQKQDDIVKTYQRICKHSDFKLRVTHHDTKISNVLFNKNDKGLCVIDLDTIMPGSFISDVGDMMRTYLCPVSEEETDLSKIEVREDFYKAIVSGYKASMAGKLTALEKEHFFFAGSFMIYMQAIRFLTDYLQNDIYYGEKYPDHNLRRAENQAMLLKIYLEKKLSFGT